MSDPLEILYLSDIRCPLERANGIQSFETCHALARRGHRVTLLVRDDTARPRRDPFAFYGRPDTPALRIVRLPMAGPHLARRVRYLLSAAWAAMRAPRSGILFTRDLGVAGVVLRIPRGWRPPLVYESHAFSPVISGTLDQLVTGGAAGGDAKLQRLFNQERRVWLGAEGYVTTTGVLAAELRGRFGDRPRETTIPNGVRLETPRSMPPPPPAGPPIAAFAGHLYPWKGADILIRALALLPDVHAIVVGGLPGETDLHRVRELARTSGVETRVRFAGQVPPSRVADLLREASVLVLPTVATPSAAYTSPLKLFEYFASGRPVVASDLPPIREVVRDGENALLFEAGNPEALAAAIQRLAGDSALAGRLARTALIEAEDYSWDRRAERLDELLRTMLSSLER